MVDGDDNLNKVFGVAAKTWWWIVVVQVCLAEYLTYAYFLGGLL